MSGGQALARESAQGPDAAGQQPSLLDRLNQMMAGGKGAWSEEQLRTMERLRDAAMKSDYAYDKLQHLTDNIGPRLSGSSQAQQAVDYVAGEIPTPPRWIGTFGFEWMLHSPLAIPDNLYSRQQVGLHGALPGGQSEATGSDRPIPTVGAAVSLNSFWTLPPPHLGQTVSSPDRIRSSKSCAQSGQRNSNNGMERDPLEIAVTVRVGRKRLSRLPLAIHAPRAAHRNRLQTARA